MVMSGTAWQLSDYYFHSLSCIINLIPHYTPFFSCIPHTARTKKGKSLEKMTVAPDQTNSDENGGVIASGLQGWILADRKQKNSV
jgi:hypothetical protein